VAVDSPEKNIAGRVIGVPRRKPMVTGFDYLSHDKVLQEHWLRRFVAIVFDYVLVYVPIWALFALVGISYIFPGFLAGFVLFLYAALFESSIGGTVGKMIMHMKAVAITGNMSFSQALMRNVSKIFPVILLLDWIVGMAVDTNDPRQKWTDQVARTSVMLYDRPAVK
jgi:uncharacterized RDD family membrane protein YckC